MKKFLYDTLAERWLHDCDTIFVISDLHFSDFDSYRFRHIIKVPDKKDYLNKFKDGDIFETYETHIKKLIEQADNDMIKKINSVVGKNCCLLCLGDVGNLECVKKLKAKRKILIMGNHDKSASNYKRNIVSTSKVLCWRVEFNGIRPPICLHEKITTEEAEEKFGNVKDIITVYEQEDNHLFDEVYEGPLMINDRTIISHEPIYPLSENMLNLHGHCHNLQHEVDKQHINFCAEAINYKPINLISLFKKGLLKDIKNIHRKTIDSATERKNNKKK